MNKKNVLIKTIAAILTALLSLTSAGSSVAVMAAAATATTSDDEKSGSAKNHDVKIDSAENGSLAFVDSAVKVLGYVSGETVTVKAVPDKNYVLESIHAYKTDALKDNDKSSYDAALLSAINFSPGKTNEYSFTMVDTNVTVKATFKKAATQEEVQESDASIKADAEKVTTDAYAAESTVKASDKSLAEDIKAEAKEVTGAEESPAKYPLLVKYLFVSSKAGDKVTMDNIFKDYNEHIISQYPQTVQSEKDGKYYVTHLGMPANSSKVGKLLDYDVAVNNLNGEVIKDAIFDVETMTVKIPVSDYNVKDAVDGIPLQIQLLYQYDDSKSTNSKVNITIENKNSNVEAVAAEQMVSANDFDVTFSFPVATSATAANISANDIDVYVNGNSVPFNKFADNAEKYAYDSTTGTYTLGASSMTVKSVRVVINESKTSSRMLNVATAHIAADGSNINALPYTLTNLDIANLHKGDWFWFKTKLSYNLGGTHWEAKRMEIMKAAANYCYGISAGGMTTDLYWDLRNGKDITDFYVGRGSLGYYNEAQRTNEIPVMFLLSNDMYRNQDANSEHFDFRTGSGWEGLLPLFCAHVTTAEEYPSIECEDWMNGKVLAVGSDYVVMGFWTKRFKSGQQDGCGIYKFKVEQPKGTVSVIKYAEGATHGVEANKLQGAKFALYGDKNGNGVFDGVENETRIGDMTWNTNCNGYSIWNIWAGTYFVVEEQAPEGYVKSDQAITVHVDVSKNTQGTDNVRWVYVAMDNAPEKGSIGISKYEEGGTAKLAGAQFDLYEDTDKDGKLTDADKRIGPFSYDEGQCTYTYTGLDSGDYIVKEVKAPNGCDISNPDYKVAHVDTSVAPDFTQGTPNNAREVWFRWEDPITVNPGKISIRKADTDTQKALAGAEFTVYKNAECTEKLGVMTDAGNGVYTMSNIEDEGDYYIKETKAPSGYVINPDVFKVTMQKKDDTITQINAVTVNENQRKDKTGSIILTKVDAETKEKISGAEFTVYRDEACTDVAGTMQETSTGVYEIDSLKAYDEVPYYVKETKAPAGYKADTSVYSVIVKANKKTVVANDNSGTNFENKKKDKPSIETTASNDETGSHDASAAKSIKITDEVRYTNLEKGKEYTLKGVIMDKKTGKALVVNGKEVTSEKKFTPTYATSVVDVTFTFDATGLDGRDIVVFEKLYLADEEIASHEDINDIGQTIHFSQIHTTAKDAKTDSHVALAEKTMTINDTVSYSSLTVGNKYSVTGKLMDKATGKPVMVDGKEITNTIEFTADKADGTIVVPFTFDGSALAGKTVVAFERISTDGKDVAIHEDINDVEQSVNIPSAKTTAVEEKSNSHSAMAVKNVTINDTVAYTNLIKGEKYKVTGVLMDKETGKAVLDSEGKEITNTVEFTAENTDGTVVVPFTFDATGLDGHTTVVFERISYNDKDVAIHEDINDVDQTVNFPTGHTEAIDAKTKDHIGKADKKVTIIDTVYYKNLITGKEYTVSGKLMDKDTGKTYVDADGKEVTGSTKFTPNEPSGKVDVIFTFNGANLESKSLVAFETVTNEDKTVFVHEDIEDESQTVHYSKVRTTAKDAQTKSNVANASKKVTIIDTVSYENLIPGKEYSVTGTLMDKETGKALGTSGATVTKKFTPTKANGTVDVSFTIDASDMEGKSTVVFENVKYNDKTVATHADLNDENQTVHFAKVHTTATDKADGDKTINAGKVTIVDRVSCYNLVPGREYKLVGTLMDKTTGKPVTVNGKTVTAEKIVTTKTANGAINIEFTFDASKYHGRELVVFEKLYDVESKVEIAHHEDINDKNQTVKVNEVVKTGNTSIYWYVGIPIAIAVLAGAAYLVIRKKKKE